MAEPFSSAHSVRFTAASVYSDRMYEVQIVAYRRDLLFHVLRLVCFRNYFLHD